MGHIAHRGDLGAMLVPKEIFRDPRLVGNERLFLCTLFEFTDNETGKCTISGKTIEELSTVPAKNFIETRKNLVKKGWLTEESGSTSGANKFQVHIPVPDGTWAYTFATDKKLTPEAWKEQVKANERKKKEDMLKKKIRMNLFYCMGPDELERELADEIELGKQWVPDTVLENFGMVRGGDNSEDARIARGNHEHERRSATGTTSKHQGVIDPFEECEPAEKPATTSGKFAGMTKGQLLDYGFKHGAESIDEATLRKVGLSRAAFPE